MRLVNATTIDIIGQACRLPGARDVAGFWQLMDERRSAIAEIGDDRWPRHASYHPRRGEAGKTYTLAAGLIDDIWGFDPAVFSISPREAEQMDPQQRLLLQVVWEALEDAGIRPSGLAGSGTGVFVGVSSLDHAQRRMFDPSSTDSYMMTGNTMSLVSNRISYIFDLHGPSFAVDTACSSSLVALDAAVQAIAAGRIDRAIVGGVNLLLAPFPFYGFSAAGMLSPEGLCRSFDANGQGYVRAEGAVALVIARGGGSSHDRPVHARIVGSGVNSDGRTVGVSLPSADHQAALLHEVYARAGIAPDALSFIEAHGTGTPVGDPVEARSLGTVLGRARSEKLLIGSVKSNIGHLEPASGLAGVLKAVLALKHDRLPASIHFNTPNPNIAFDELNLRVAAEPAALKRTAAPRHAGINSFGFGGTNAHIIIADAPGLAEKPPRPAAVTSPPAPGLLMLSAEGDGALSALAARHADLLEADSGLSLEALANANAWRREWLPDRLALLAGGRMEAIAALRAWNAGPQGGERSDIVTGRAIGQWSQQGGQGVKAVFVYSGNGSQWAGMGRLAHQKNAGFREKFDEIDRLFRPLGGWSLSEALFAADLATRLESTTVAQPLLFALQVALTGMLGEMGLCPHAVLGHSVGEVAAAHAAGAVALEDAVRIIYMRSHHQEVARGAGKMAALMLPQAEAQALIGDSGLDGVEIAATNSPRSVTISGPAAGIRKAARIAAERGLVCKVLDLDYPFHSALVDPVRAPLVSALDDLHVTPTARPFISTVEGGALAGEALTGDYWWRNVRQPVRFADAIAAAAALGCQLFVEIGPRPVLSAYVRDTLRDSGKASAVIAGFSADDPKDADPVARCFARALTQGAEVDCTAVFGADAGAAVTLPAYPWQNRTFRAAPSADALTEGLFDTPAHPLLGWRQQGDHLIWHSHVDGLAIPWLADHKVDGRMVVPGAAFAEMALAAGRIWLGGDTVEIRDMDIVQPLILSDTRLSEVRLEISPDAASFQIASRPRLSGEDWQVHAMGRLAVPPGGAARGAQPPRWNGAAGADIEALYALARRHGLDYGPAFRRLDAVRRVSGADGQKLIELRLRPDDEADFPYGLDPVGFDACFHGLLMLYEEAAAGARGLSYIPVRFGALTLIRPQARITSARIVLRRAGVHSLVADFELFDQDGALCATLDDARFRAAALVRRPALDRLACHVAATAIARPWEAARSPAPALEKTMALSATYALDWHEADEEARLLLEAAAQRLAYDAVRSEGANEAGGVHVRLSDADGKSRGARRETLLAALLMVLTEAGLAEAGDATGNGGWHVPEADDLPPLGDILKAVMSDHPDWGVAGLMLTRAATLYPAMLGPGSGEDGAPQDPPYMAATLDHFLTASPAARLRIRAVAGLVEAIADGWPPARPLRILQLGACGGALARLLMPLVARGRGRYMVAERDRLAAERLRHGFAENAAFEAVQADDLASLLAREGPVDLVIAAGGLHQLGDADDTLALVRGHMGAGALLIAVETPPDAFHDVVLGLLPHWFEHTADPEFPVGALRSRRDWRKALADAGFAETAARPLPDDGGHDMLLVARNDEAAPAATGSRRHPRRPVWIAARRAKAEMAFADKLAGELERLGHRVTRLKPAARAAAGDLAARWPGLDERLKNAESPPVIVDLVHAFDAGHKPDVLEKRAFNLSGLFLAGGAGGLEGARLAVLCPGGARAIAGMGASSPAQAGVWSFARSAANEHGDTEISLIDLAGDLGADAAPAMLARWLSENADGENGGETEIILGPDGAAALRVARGLPASASEPTTAEAEMLPGSRLEPGPGSGLDRLRWGSVARVRPGPGEVEIEVAAAGLNFRDVMWTLGMLPDEALEDGFAGATLGFECAGRIARVGDGVERLVPGDPVIVFAPACFASHVTVAARAVARMPDGTDLVAAATIPVAFLTAYYALCHLARLEAGEWVLIHGGAGGVGLAALQIARWRGAKIIATAGTEEKRQFVRMLGADHVLDSRSLAFSGEVMALTGGGVDVVLNSLAGEAMERSLELVRPFGRFLELGKRDYYTNTKIGLRPFRRNVSYFGIDADQLLSHRAGLGETLFAELAGHFEAGRFRPLVYRQFAGSDAVDAFRLMQTSGHVGKIVIVPERGEGLPGAPGHAAFAGSDDGAHIIVGGLGGFGLAAAEWLRQGGAREIVLIGRRPAADAEATGKIDALTSRGVKVTTVACDVADRAALARCLARLRKETRIVGVIHAAMVLDDAAIANLDEVRIKKVLDPKVAGAFNLDRLTRDDPLDYFVLFSSVTTLIGNPGQAAYVAANGYLEGLAHKRRGDGLPGLAVGWGAITDAGYLARNREAGERISRRTGAGDFRAEDALSLLGELLARGDDAVITLAPMNWATAARALPLLSGPTYKVLARLGEMAGQAEDGERIDLAAEIEGLDDEQATDRIRALLLGEIAAILRLPADEINTARPLQEVGMDSLMGMELRMGAQERLGFELPLVTIAEGLTIDQIAAKVLTRLRAPDGASGVSAAHDTAARRHFGTLVDDLAPELVQDISRELTDREKRMGRLIHSERPV